METVWPSSIIIQQYDDIQFTWARKQEVYVTAESNDDIIEHTQRMAPLVDL